MPAKKTLVFPQGAGPNPFTFPILTSSSPLPNATVNQPYTFTFTEIGGTPPFTWASTPTGAFTFNTSTGVLSGTGGVAGTFNFSVQCTDSLGFATGFVPFQLTVAANAPSITSSSPLPNAQINVPYSFTFNATGGTPPYTWSSSGTGAFSLNSSTGVLSGTGTTLGTFTFTVTVTDSLGAASAPTSFQLTVATTPGTFFMAPNGNDTNPGTLASPWSITAFNNNASSYAGNHVYLTPGTYTQGQNGATVTSLFSLCNAQASGSKCALNVNGGSSATSTLFSLPSTNGILGFPATGQNFFVRGTTDGGPAIPNGVMVTLSNQKNPNTATGDFQVNGWNAGALTGFTPGSPSTAQLSYAASGTSPTSTIQWETNNVGAYMQTVDLPGSPANSKMGMWPQISYASGTQFTFTGLSDVLTHSLNLQVPTATVVTGTNKNAGVNLDTTWYGPGGILVSISCKMFFFGGSVVPPVSVSQDPVTSTYLVNVPLDATAAAGYMTVISGEYTNTPFSGFSARSFSISGAQFQAGLALLQANFGATAITSLDPTQYSLHDAHINAEIHFTSGTNDLTMGWSCNSWNSTLQQFTPTFVGSCDASGNPLDLTADIYPADPATGNRPSAPSNIIGQGLGQVTNTGNVTIKGLIVHYGYQGGIGFRPALQTGTYPYLGSSQNTGIKVQNNVVYDIAGNANNNMGGLYFDQCIGVYCGNNVVHDIINSTTGANLANCNGIHTFNCRSNLYELNTIYNVPSGVHDKNQGPGAQNGNHTYRNNLIEIPATLGGVSLAGPGPCCINGCAGGNSGDVTTVHNNILYSAASNYWQFSDVTVPSPEGIVFYNNTCIYSYAGNAGVTWGINNNSVQSYNNIIVNLINGGFAFAVPDGGKYTLGAYNIADNPGHAPSFGTVPNGTTTFPTPHTLAAFQTATGEDTTSAIATPTFTGAAGVQNANNYKLTGSVGIGFGHVGGVAGGTSVNAGAWDSIVTQIGSSLVTSGFDGVVAMSGAGRLVNRRGTTIQLRGVNFPMDSQVVGAWPSQPGGPYFGSDGPPFPLIKTWKMNFARITLNAAAFLNTPQGVLQGTPSAPTWTGTNIAGDRSLAYKPLLLKLIQGFRSIGVYMLFDCHWSGPSFTFGGVTKSVGAWGQPPFLDSGQGMAMWTAGAGTGPIDFNGNPSTGFVAWLAQNFGSAAFNTTNNINGGAAGALWNSAYGGASGFGDCIFELFNEPKYDQLAAASFNSASGGGGTTLTYQQVQKSGGWCSVYNNNGSGTGPGGIGLPSSVIDGNGNFPQWWQSPGYQTVLNGIRALGATNIIQCNTDSFAHKLCDAPQVLPTDTLAVSQISLGWHDYESGTSGWPLAAAGGCVTETSGTQSATLAATQFMNGTGSLANPIPVILTEYAPTQCGSGATDSGFMPNMHNVFDAQPTGSNGVAAWVWNTLGAPQNGTGVQNQFEACYSSNMTFSASQSGTTMTLTSNVTGTPVFGVGSVITAGLGSAQTTAYDRPFVVALLSGTNGQTGATYQLSSAHTAAPGACTAVNIIPMPIQGTDDFNWMTAHAP